MSQLAVSKSRCNPKQGDQITLVIGDGSLGHLCSAVWSIPELPGVFLRQGTRTDGSKPCRFWQVVFHAVAYGSAEKRYLAEQTAGLLQGQFFATRREALQALEAVLLITALGSGVESPPF